MYTDLSKDLATYPISMLIDIDEDLKEFELIITLKTEIFRVDLNFLDKGDLLTIDEIAFDMGIANYLTAYDLDEIYNSDYADIRKIHSQWCDDIISAYEECIKKLMKKINGKLN